MTSLLPVLSLILLLAFLPGCASSVSQEVLLCDPPQAEIYWGKTENSLEKTRLTTPSSRSLSASKWESWCYQVKKEGYRDSEITCRGEEGFRYLDIPSHSSKDGDYLGAARSNYLLWTNERPAGENGL